MNTVVHSRPIPRLSANPRVVRNALPALMMTLVMISASHAQSVTTPPPATPAAPTPSTPTAPAAPATPQTSATPTPKVEVDGENRAKTFAFLPNVPTSVKATYKVMKAGISIGTVTEKFERIGTRGDQYRISSSTRAEGLALLFVRDQLTYTSSGRITTQGLVPTTFTSTRSEKADRNFTSRFDWGKNEIVRERNVEGRVERDTYELSAGTQDRLSIMYQFMIATPRTAAITAWMTQGREAEQYMYVKRDEPTIATPVGEFETVHYARDAKPNESKVELWLAKSKNYLPVRVVFADPRGTSLEQTLVELVIQ
jgi:Protein of unknown function (DUF3108)